MGERGRHGERPEGNTGEITLESVEFLSGHGALKGCGDGESWRDEGEPCPKPEWTPERRGPASHTMGEPIRLAVAANRAGVELTGKSTATGGGLTFAPVGRAGGNGGRVIVASTRDLPRKVQQLSLDLRWSAGGAPIATETSHLVYVTLGRPAEDHRSSWPEDGVTLKRMGTAVSWVEPLETVEPHAIVEGLLSRFPYYTLQPSPKVPKKYGHPRYFNNEGGAWAMAEHPEESGECQAIARFVRGVLRQVGAPGELRVRLVWADPRVNGGRTPLEADWEEEPGAGLDATRRIRGRRCIAALVDGPVEEGKSYPPSHTILRNGRVSPGLNRYEAFVRFSHGRETRYYAAGASGAGPVPHGPAMLRVFWGLIWVSLTRGEGFRVEEIVARYR